MRISRRRSPSLPPAHSLPPCRAIAPLARSLGTREFVVRGALRGHLLHCCDSPFSVRLSSAYLAIILGYDNCTAARIMEFCPSAPSLYSLPSFLPPASAVFCRVISFRAYEIAAARKRYRRICIMQAQTRETRESRETESDTRSVGGRGARVGAAGPEKFEAIAERNDGQDANPMLLA